jgi:hypothetical protein
VLRDTDTEGATSVFKAERYPALCKWFSAMRAFMDRLPNMETRTSEPESVLRELKLYESTANLSNLAPTPNKSHAELDLKNGLLPGTRVSVVPDDTGRDK